VGNIITLISYLTAKEGFKFVFTGPTPECLKCRFNYVCNGKLKVGQIYEVVKVYGIRNKCPINEFVETVEVREASIEVAVSRKVAIEDMIISYNKVKCDLSNCSNYSRCVPQLIVRPVKLKVLKVLNSVNCPKRLELSNALVKIVEVL
jgi:uncharacterized protein (UPF0179 family)